MKVWNVLRFGTPRNFNKGTRHWLTQRLSSIALIPLTTIFLFSYVQHIGLGYEYNILFYQNPFRASIAFLFVSFTLLHLKQGVEVVIEDYVHDIKIHKVLRKINTIFLWSMIGVIFFALVKIVIEHNWS